MKTPKVKIYEEIEAEEKEEEKKEEHKSDAKLTNTAFILMFPTLILAGIGAWYAPLLAKFVVIALTVYQFLMTKKFIQDYYKR